MILLKCAECDNKKSRFTNKQEASVLLRNLVLKHFQSKVLY